MSEFIGYKTGIYSMDGNTASDELVEANAKKILDIKTQIHELLKEAEHLADEANLEFHFSVTYGMGGTYVPVAARDEYDEEYSNDGWRASSHSC